MSIWIIILVLSKGASSLSGEELERVPIL